jgi:exosortase B
LWQEEAYAHGPLVAGIVAWLFVRQSRPSSARPGVPTQLSGWVCLLAGLSAYVIGRSVGIAFIETSALIPIAAGLLLITAGVQALRSYWFALLFLFFLVPLPDFVLEAVTGTLKWRISWATELLLHAAGYPIARSGVMLSIGQYQLLIADACSGLNSLFSLGAMGLLYLYLQGYRSVARQAILLAAIVPIAIAANLLRVVVLVLLTYHFGDEAGQGFMHGAAGLFLFAVSLLILFGLDRLLGAPPATAAAEARP